MSHTPVLLDAVLQALLPAIQAAPHTRLIDGTLGAGGHTRALLETASVEVLGMDLDADALDLARQTLASYGNRIHFAQASYVTMAIEAARLGWDAVDAILLDLGVSSMQVDTPERGFSFRHDGPLDMRFGMIDSRPTAEELVNYRDESELAELFFRYGEERFSRPIARAIARARPLTTTRQLAEVIERAIPRAAQKHRRRDSSPAIHPATRVFQALRIAVNDELRVVERALPIAIDLLRPGGRLAVISFHSLEDRLVKQAFREASTEIVAPPGMASLPEKAARVRLMTRKPVEADETEASANPRSRSARLRVVEKLPTS